MGTQWYYAKGQERHGPIPESEIMRMLETGELGSDSLVWSTPMKEWTLASEVPTLRASIAGRPPELPQELPPSPSAQQLQRPAMPPVHMAEGTHERAVSQVRSWVRYWARIIDLWLFAFVAALVLVFVAPSLLLAPEIVLNMVALFLWIFVEASLLSSWGTTPGKWLLRTRVRESTGQKLAFSSALNRSFSVWWRGMGTGFPIATLITLIVAHGRLKSEGVTSWDKEGGFVVSHEKIGPLRVIVAVLFFVGMIWLMVAEEPTYY